MEYFEEKSDRINYKKSIKTIFFFAKNYKSNFITVFILFIITTIIRMISPILIKRIIDFAIKNKDIKYLIFIIFIYFIVNMMFFLLNYTALLKLVRTGQKLIYSLKSKIYKTLLLFDIDYFSSNNPGKLAARVQSDTTSIYEIFTEASISIFIDIIIFIVVFSIMFYHSPSLTMILIPIVLVIMLFIYLFVSKSQKLFLGVRKKIAQLTSFISENLNFLSLIKIYDIENYIKDRFNIVNYEKFLKTVSAEYIAITFFLSIMLFDPISKSVIFGYGGIKVLNNYLSIGTVVMFVLYVGQLFEPLFRFSEYVSVVQKSFSGIERVNQIFSLKTQIIDGEKYIDDFNKEIEFNNLWMKYPSSDWILKSINFKIEKGRSVAIVGRTGSGKTTLVNLLFRFYDYQKGSIKIDGIELKDININSIRKNIGLVQQDLYLFPGTILDNLTLMDETIEESRIKYAIKILGFDDFYKKHLLDKYIREKGSNLSSGEKQLISLTRTLVLNQPIIILDEATSNIDPYTEELITNAIKNVMKLKTMIIIAHRLKTIKNADKIIFLKDGSVVESGSHDELMLKKSYYYNYYMLQE